MFRNAIEGLDNVIDTEIPHGSIIMIAGLPGSLKSGLTYNLLSNHLKNNPDEFGMYVTLEETTESHLKNMQSLGIDIPDNLLISDYSDIRERFENKSSLPNLVQMINGVIEYFKNEKGEQFTVFALDSLNALYSLIEYKDLRVKMFHFFKQLREKELASILIMEIPSVTVKEPTNYSYGEAFLVDGLIRTGEIETQQDVMLYMQVKKMRAVRHSRKKHLIEIGESGISILGPIFT
ncbi:RAD55 family ATPase [[Eubacterium] cellulosolvens]